ncbi:MAG: nucleoside:proton symporter [Proteobacteria bacterium]|nr:nucleoside:proton symporter [Pseudomonadota bacterium]
MRILDFRPLIAIFLIFFIVFLFSENKKNIAWRFVLQGFILQCFCIIIALFFKPLKTFLQYLTNIVHMLKEATLEGTSFVFGYLGGAPLPFAIKEGASSIIFGFQILPLLIVVSAISMVLFHYKIIPFIVRCLSPIFQKILNIGGAMGVIASAKLFLSQMETPILVRPYLENFTRTELLMVMACGMSTTAAAAIPLYAMILENSFTNVISHILVASFISIPASITLSRILIPEGHQKTKGDIVPPYEFKNGIDAISRGAVDGMNVFWNVISMLIVFAAIIFLINVILKKITLIFLGQPHTLQDICGYLFAPFTWLMGIPWVEAKEAASLLSTKTFLNEVFAFINLSKCTLSEHSKLIMLYALCGFANFSSVGMVIGSLGSLVPTRRDDIIALAPKALFIGTLSTCLSGIIMGFLNLFCK